jgi:hypothetical protein
MALELRKSQALLYRLITAPEGVAAGLARERSLPRGGLGAVIGGDARLAPAARLDIYANMYFYRLLGVLKEDFPATAAALGADVFHNIVTGYLTEYPPVEASVFWAGSHLADYLRAHPICGEFPYAAGLAAFERAIVEVFCARDTVPLKAAAMRATPPARWAGVRMRAIAALRMIETDWRIVPARRKFESGRKWKPPASGPSTVLVWRRDAKVFYREVGALEAMALARLRRGAAFGAICTCVGRALAEQGAARDAGAAVKINAMLAQWLRDGIVAAPGIRKRRV